MKNVFIVLLLFPILSIGQKGIEFEHDLTWTKVIQKAKEENKYLFVDAFATWCGPCKYMSAKIFTQDNVGALFNSSFINVKVQMDSTSKDNEEVKKWYADAKKMAEQYNINVYPTYLFFNPEGKLVHRLVGSMEAEAFLSKAKNAMNEGSQYYPMLNKYKSGQKEPDFLKRLANTAGEAYDMENAQLIANDYLATQDNLLTDENVDFIFNFTNNSKGFGFKALLENESKINQLKKNSSATDRLVEIIKQEELAPYLKRKNAPIPDWKIISAAISKKYPKHADEVILGGKVAYYKGKKDWVGFQSAIQPYMNKYGEKATPAQLNDYAWTVFENCTESKIINDAIIWSKLSIKDKEDPAFIDTYANLLYKSGKNQDALKWEEKALSMVSDQERADFEATIEKMKKGIKTWK